MRLITATVVLLLSLVVRPAGAMLASEWAGKVNVDTSYLTGASQPTDIAFAADGRAVLTQKGGGVIVRRVDGSINSLAYPFGGTLDSASEKGLLGVVADPEVAANLAFYFYVSNGPTNDKHRVYRATLTPTDTLIVDPTPIIAASRGNGPGLEGPANHDGGGLAVYDNQLYVAVGDTGANASPPTNKYGSCLNKGNGKILRVNLDGSVPADNPLVALASVTACTSPNSAWTTAAPDPRVYAWGFRNPWRLSVDPETGLMWIGDVGESTEEEVSVGGGDAHYGYPFVEGARVWGNVDGKNCNLGTTPGRPCTAPVFSYPRSQGQAISGGYLLDTPAWQQIFGGVRYVYGDSSSHWVRVLQINAARNGVASAVPAEFANFSSSRPVAFRPGPDGALYVVYLGLGAVYRFAPIAQTCTDCAATPIPVMPLIAAAALAAALATYGWRRISSA